MYQDILAQIVRSLGELLDVDAATVDIHTRFEDFGLASAEAVMLIGDLEDLLGRSLEPEVFYQHPSAAELARFLAGAATGGSAVSS